MARARTGRDPSQSLIYSVSGVAVGAGLVAFALGTAAAAVWLGLTYALPWSIVAAAHRPVLGEINGTWLVWVVAPQALSIVAAPPPPGSRPTSSPRCAASWTGASTRARPGCRPG